MRRDYFTLKATNLDADGVPTVSIEFEGPADELLGRLTDPTGEPLNGESIDVAYRLHGPVDESPAGVVAVTNRVTGEFILELNADCDDVLSFVDAAREYGKDTDEEHRYRIRVTVDGKTRFEHEKGTFLVYDADGELLRQHSLIPSGVEL